MGAVFRSAAALNMDGILLTPNCSDPLYRRAIRVSMGTVFQIPWAFLTGDFTWPDAGIKHLHELGFKTAAMALDDNSVPIDDPRVMKEENLLLFWEQRETDLLLTLLQTAITPSEFLCLTE